jgi:hypothetical protein
MATRKKIQPVTVRTVTPKVYRTGLYSSTTESKTAELTLLLQGLLVNGVFENINDAVKEGVPAGTLVVIDDPNTGNLDFTVEVVPITYPRRG